MKPCFLLLVMCFLINDLHAQQNVKNDCLQYHKGKFSYLDSSNHLITVKRKNKFQVETNKATNVWTNFRIKWINDCQYELTQVGTNSRSVRKNNKRSTEVIISKALGIGGYQYTCACKDTLQPKITGMMNKLNK